MQQYGRAGADYQILVQLPGVDDPAHVRELIGTAAVLEIDDVKDGPYPSRDAALAQHGGILPLNTKLVKVKPRGSGEGEQWYLVGKNPVISGREMRNARPGQDESADGRPISPSRPMAASVSAVTPKPNRQQARGGPRQPGGQRGHH